MASRRSSRSRWPAALSAFLVPGAGSFPVAVAVSAIVLLAVGAARAPFIRRSRTWAGVEMLVIGGLAAGAAYAVGLLVGPLLP